MTRMIDDVPKQAAVDLPDSSQISCKLGLQKWKKKHFID